MLEVIRDCDRDDQLTATDGPTALAVPPLTGQPPHGDLRLAGPVPDRHGSSA